MTRTEPAGSSAVFVGVDLAWGMRHQSGLAAVDEKGALLTLTQRHTDAELLAWFDAWAPGPAVFGFDAPLLVANATGQRTAERMVARHFGRYHAGAHAANRSMPHFAEGGRAFSLVTQLNLDLDPRGNSARRCLEVYPHPAIVMLFGLDQVLQYKNRSTRSLDFRRQQLLLLMTHLESLTAAEVSLDVTATPEWPAVRALVESAPTKAALSRCEDSIDAVVCAYIALFAQRRPALTAVLGSTADGCILTPVTAEVANRIEEDQANGSAVSLLASRVRC